MVSWAKAKPPLPSVPSPFDRAEADAGDGRRIRIGGALAAGAAEAEVERVADRAVLVAAAALVRAPRRRRRRLRSPR